jgi:spore coat protein U-like protein
MSGAASGNNKTRWHGVLIALLAMVSTHAVAQSCTVGTGGTLAFGSVVALASTANQSTDSGQSFKVKCDSGVAGTLRLYSATPRVMQNITSSLPFNLSLNSGAANDDLPTAPLGAPFDITRNGTDQAVILYAKIFTQNFKSLPSGLYSAAIVLTLEY